MIHWRWWWIPGNCIFQFPQAFICTRPPKFRCPDLEVRELAYFCPCFALPFHFLEVLWGGISSICNNSLFPVSSWLAVMKASSKDINGAQANSPRIAPREYMFQCMSMQVRVYFCSFPAVEPYVAETSLIYPGCSRVHRRDLENFHELPHAISIYSYTANIASWHPIECGNVVVYRMSLIGQIVRLLSCRRFKFSVSNFGRFQKAIRIFHG